LAFLPVEAEPALLLPLLERPHVENQLKINSRLYSYRDEEGPDAAFAQITRELALEKKTLGVELLQMRVLELRRIETHALGCRITGLEEGLAQLRMIKDESEIDSLRKAVALTEKTLQKTIDAIRPGMSEREIASVYQLELLKSGGDEISFTPLVVSGPNTGSPHASPGERVVQQGDLVTLDCGARWNGYAGDITRSVALGTVDPELERIYEIVQAANEAGRKACKPGIAAQEVDRAARRVIEEAGYGKYFIHRTGHGLGVDVHEPPYILEGNRQELQPGMTFTVEPGIYLPGKGGVRIEDNMLITSRGAETLTSFPRELIHL
jgi:Xaa-Pro dipeptidase